MPIVSYRDREGVERLLDGRNRIAAAQKAGLDVGGLPRETLDFHSSFDPYAYVVSANLRRRHLSPEQKRDVIAALLKAQPEKSNRRIATMADSNRTTVGEVRSGLEATGDVSITDTRTDAKGRRQPARKGRDPLSNWRRQHRRQQQRASGDVSITDTRSRLRQSPEHLSRALDVAEPAPAITSAPTGTGDSDSLKTYLALLPDDQTLVRQIWSAAQHEAAITPGPPGQQRELSLTERITAALDRIRELTPEIETAGADTFDVESLGALVDRVEGDVGALKLALRRHQPGPPPLSVKVGVIPPKEVEQPRRRRGRPVGSRNAKPREPRARKEAAGHQPALPVIDRLLAVIRAAGDAGLAKNQIFTRAGCRTAMPARDLDALLLELQDQGKIGRKPPAPDGRLGRPAERYYIMTGAAQ
jgi:hypothetical protein